MVRSIHTAHACRVCQHYPLEDLLLRLCLLLRPGDRERDLPRLCRSDFDPLLRPFSLRLRLCLLPLELRRRLLLLLLRLLLPPLLPLCWLLPREWLRLLRLLLLPLLLRLRLLRLRLRLRCFPLLLTWLLCKLRSLLLLRRVAGLWPLLRSPLLSCWRGRSCSAAGEGCLLLPACSTGASGTTPSSASATAGGLAAAASVRRALRAASG